jgi:hypothetical protein
MRRMTTTALGIAAVAAVLTLSACDDGSNATQSQDAQTSSAATSRMIQNQPVQAGAYSPTRATINAWVQTWESGPGKRYYAYFYVNGQPIGYYVLTGPPVSYAAGATSPFHIECPGSDGNACQQMPNPGQDAAFANAGTGQFQFYGQDATTHRMLEWGGVGMTYFGSDKPLPIPAPPLGDTK